jgi:2-methylcitrate dehydratase PrpD
MTTVHQSASSAATSRILAEFLADITIADLSSQVREHTVRSVLDWLGSAVAGSFERPARRGR